MISWGQFFPFSLPSITLPTLSIPINIQRRFLSFVLKRTLGHLVRPGQLDTHQIDAQIGNGWIEITDIELADEVS
jgi:autophagy-related protein 2